MLNPSHHRSNLHRYVIIEASHPTNKLVYLQDGPLKQYFIFCFCWKEDFAPAGADALMVVVSFFFFVNVAIVVQSKDTPRDNPSFELKIK